MTDENGNRNGMLQIIRLRAALCEIEEIADDEVDITNNGGPNAAMRIQAIARNALAGVIEP